MKLSKVEYAPKHDVSGILTFYMGKNTPERKDFIMGNLVVPVRSSAPPLHHHSIDDHFALAIITRRPM